MESEITTYTWPQMPRPPGGGGEVWYQWHGAINAHSDEVHKAGKEFPHWMYQAKTAAAEVPRMALLFKNEREGTLRTTYRKCACCSEGKHIQDNHLTCCLGVKCRECPHLAALDKAKLPAEERDWLKAWTCSGHILSKGGDVMGEGFILTVDDVMFWDSVNRSFSSQPPDITE